MQDPDTYATHNVKYILFAQVDLEVTQGSDFLTIYGSAFNAQVNLDQNVLNCTVKYRDVSTGETLSEGDVSYGGYDYDDGSGYGYCSDYSNISSVIFADPEDSANVTVSEIEVILTAMLSDNTTLEYIGRIKLK